MRKQDGIEYILNDYINQHPKGKYATIIMIYCDMGTHSDSDRRRLLDSTSVVHSLTRNAQRAMISTNGYEYMHEIPVY